MVKAVGPDGLELEDLAVFRVLQECQKLSPACRISRHRKHCPIVVHLAQNGLNRLDLTDPCLRNGSIKGNEQFQRVADFLGLYPEIVKLLT